jgi:hypothetical protein
LGYITPSIVDSNKLRKKKHVKTSWIPLAIRTKIKVFDFISDYEFSLGVQNIKTNMNILPLGSYDVIIIIDWLEMHKAVLYCYDKSLKYKDENDTARIVKGIQKPISVRQILAMKFKKFMRKGCHIYAIQVTNLL